MLVLVALLATRAFIPTGWMPVVDHNIIRLELCSGQQMVTPPQHSEHAMHMEEHGKDAPRETCPYATVAHAVDVPALPSLAEAPPLPAVQPVPILEQQLVRSLHAPRPPTRGPPAFA